MFSRIILLILLSHIVKAQPPRLVLPIGHTESILTACFSSDDKYIVTGSYDKTIKLWETQTGMLLNEYIGHKNGVNHVAFSDDGKYIISEDYDRVCKFWSVNDAVYLGDTVYNWTESPRVVYAPKLFYSDDETRKAVVQQDSLLVFNNITQQKINTIRIPYLIIEPGFTPDKNIILARAPTTVVENYSHVIFNVISGTALPVKLTGPLTTTNYFSHDSKKILSIADTEVTLFNLLNGEVISVLKGSTTRPVDGPVFNDDNSKIITIDQSGSIRTWFNDAAILEPAIYGKTTLGIALINGKKNIIRSSEDSTSIDIVNLENNRVIKQLKTGKPTETFEFPDLEDAKKLNEYVSRLPIRNVSLNPQETRLAISTAPPGAGLWNMETGKFLKGFLMNDYIAENYWSPDGKKWLITSKILPPMLCDGFTGSVIDTLKFQGKTRADYRREMEKKKPAADSTRDIFDEPPVETDNSDQLWSEANYVTAAAFSPDGNMIITGVINGSVTAWSARDGKELYGVENPDYMEAGQNSWINKIVFSPDGKKIATASWDKTVKLRDAQTGKLLANIKDHHAVVNAVQFSPDGTALLSVADTGAIKIWSAADGQYMGELRKPSANLSGIEFSNDGKQITATSSDNCMNVWDVQTRKLLYSFFQVDSSDYMYILPSGYYKASGLATKKLHYVTKDLDVMTFEQLDVKYNRPDKILEATGSNSKFLVESYRSAYNKRLLKLGIDSSAFSEKYSMPVAEILNANIIPAEQKIENLALHIKASDSIFKLDRFNVWINEVPLFGMKGVSIRRQERNDLDTTISVLLSGGENRIEVSVININGVESYRKPLLVKHHSDTAKKSKIYFIGVGINEFADSSHNLKWCVQDIRDLTKVLQKKYDNRLVIVDTIYNEKATRTRIRGLKKKLLNTTVNDEVIFSYSGHGLLSKDYDYYISSYTVNFNNPEEGGIPYDEIENMLDSIPARKKILLLDACHSGELDKEEMKKIQSATAGLAQNQVSINEPARGVIITNTDSTSGMRLQNSFDLMQSLFVNVARGTGAVIIAASGGVQFAQEKAVLGHGVFTYSVIEAIQKFPSIKVSELKKYVSNRVMELTNGLQKPVSRNEMISVDWDIW